MFNFKVNAATIVVVSKKDSEFLHLGNDVDGYFQIYSVTDEEIVLCDGLNKAGLYNSPDYTKRLANEDGMKAFNLKLDEYKASAKHKDNMIKRLIK